MSVAPSVCVVGAGLAGCMAAALLGQLGCEVTVFEKRSDPRDDEDSEQEGSAATAAFGLSTSATKRSINLALSHRGMCALEAAGLLDKIMGSAIRMPCRVIHDRSGGVVKQAYGTSDDEAIWSVGRQTINSELLNLISSKANIKVLFEHALASVDKAGLCVFKDTKADRMLEPAKYDLVIGADGAYSTVRECILRLSRVNFSREYIGHGYKELSIPPNSNGTYALPDVNGLHIWPRGRFMLIALPNPDKSFTVTLFAPYKGEDGFDSVDASDGQQVREYFERHFPDVLPLMPDLEADFASNPVGSLVTVRVSPWRVGKILLVGDAAHAVVPFYGQGMNAAFEDCLMLYESVRAALLATARQSVEEVDLCAAADVFARSRESSANALADLCIAHYADMASSTSSLLYLLQRRAESLAHKLFPKLYVPLYSMVAFSRTPYDHAVARDKMQTEYVFAVSCAFAATAAATAAGLMYSFSSRRAP